MLSQIIQVFLLAMTPLGELRAAIPIGLAVYHLNWLEVYLIAVLGNLLPAFFLLLFLPPAQKFLSQKSRAFAKFFSWLFKRTSKRGAGRVEKYGWLGLVLFVAVPLPLTGAWTGSVLAFLFKIPFRKALLSIVAGVLIAGGIVSLATKAGIAISQYFGWQTLIIILIAAVLVWILFKKLKIKPRRRAPKENKFPTGQASSLRGKN